ncbi:MAG: hypothetical protein AAF456_18685 [Planctomycetota bacterium]
MNSVWLALILFTYPSFDADCSCQAMVVYPSALRTGICNPNQDPAYDAGQLETFLMFEAFIPTLELSDEQMRRFRESAKRMLVRRTEIELEFRSEPELARQRITALQHCTETFANDLLELLEPRQLQRIGLFERRFRFATQTRRYTTFCIQERQVLELDESQVNEVLKLQEKIDAAVIEEVEPFRERIQGLVKLEREEVERVLEPLQVQILVDMFGQDYRGALLEPADRAFGVYSKRNFLRTSDVFSHEYYGLERPSTNQVVVDEDLHETRRAMWILSGIVFNSAVVGDLEPTREQLSELERIEEEHRGSSMAVATLRKVMDVLVPDQQRRVIQLYTRSLFSMATGGRLAVYVRQFIAEDLVLSDAQIDELARVASALDERFDAECEVYHHNAFRVFNEEKSECMRILRPEQVEIVNQLLGEGFDDFEFGTAAGDAISKYLVDAYSDPDSDSPNR